METFAGFTLPHLVTITRKNLRERLAEFKKHKRPICGPYHVSQFATDDAASFYHESDFFPGLRWQWCDEHAAGPDHKGWFTDDQCDETARGIVFRLPNNRGFLAGWSLGREMCGSLSRHVYKSERDAVHAADDMARVMAEDAREYDDRWQQASRASEAADEARQELKAARFELRNVVRAVRDQREAGRVADSVCRILRDKARELRREVSEHIETIRKARERIEELDMTGEFSA